MAYKRFTLATVLEIKWEQAKDTIERWFKKVDTETQSIKDEMERIDESENLLNDRVVICQTATGFDIVYDDNGDIVTTR